MVRDGLMEEGSEEGREVRDETGELVYVDIVSCYEREGEWDLRYHKFGLFMPNLLCCCWMLFVEACHQFRCGYIGCRYPHVVGVWIASPFDQIL